MNERVPTGGRIWTRVPTAAESCSSWEWQLHVLPSSSQLSSLTCVGLSDSKAVVVNAEQGVCMIERKVVDVAVAPPIGQ